MGVQRGPGAGGSKERQGGGAMAGWGDRPGWAQAGTETGEGRPGDRREQRVGKRVGKRVGRPVQGRTGVRAGVRRGVRGKGMAGRARRWAGAGWVTQRAGQARRKAGKVRRRAGRVRGNAERAKRGGRVTATRWTGGWAAGLAWPAH